MTRDSTLQSYSSKTSKHKWQSPLGPLLRSNWWTRRVLAPEIQDAHHISRALGIIRARWPNTFAVNDAAKPIFIMSAGWGCGSTLLQRLIVSARSTMIWGEPLDHAVPVHRLAQMLVPVTDSWPRDSYFQAHAESRPLQDQWIANLTPPIDVLRKAHVAFFEKWLRDAAADRGCENWGFKEVRLTAHHARYLQWLFPNAKFVFIYRDVLDSYRSCKGVHWLSVWPDYPVAIPSAFAHHWRLLLGSFLECQKDLNALLIRYEDLITNKTSIADLSDFVGIGPLDHTILGSKVGSRSMRHADLSRHETIAIRSIADELRITLGYS